MVRKEKLHKAKPKLRLGKVQQEDHDARSVGTETESAVHVDDEPVVLVGDKPVEDKPLIDERKDIAACVPVSVDRGVQTDDDCADRVSVRVVPRVDGRSYVSTHVKRFVGAAVWMHKGKDGHDRQLCGPGFTSLQGRTAKAHVQRQKAPARVPKGGQVGATSLPRQGFNQVPATARVDAVSGRVTVLARFLPRHSKEKRVAPQFIWRRKSSQAGQEGGCGVEGKQDLKMAKTRDVVADITPPFRAGPQALRTTLLEGGEDDMGQPM